MTQNLLKNLFFLHWHLKTCSSPSTDSRVFWLNMFVDLHHFVFINFLIWRGAHAPLTPAANSPYVYNVFLIWALKPFFVKSDWDAWPYIPVIMLPNNRTLSQASSPNLRNFILKSDRGKWSFWPLLGNITFSLNIAS